MVEQMEIEIANLQELTRFEVVAEAYTTQPNSKASSRVLYMYFSCMAG